MRGWRRLGIALSVLWFIGCFILLWQSEVDGASEFVSALIGTCTQIRGRTFDNCWDEASPFFFKPSWAAAGVFAAIAAAPIPIFWLLASIVYRVGRRVRASSTGSR